MVDTNLSSKVELEISCRNLPRLDTFSKSDPFVVLSIKDVKTGKVLPIGHTEVQKNNENPTFKTKFTVDYKFEEAQELTFEVYDADETVKTDYLKKLDKHDFVGSHTLTLGELVAAPGQRATAVLRKKSGAVVPFAVIVINAEEMKESSEFCKIEIKGDKLAKMDLFGKSDPFLRIYRTKEGGEKFQIKETEVIKNTLSPSWKPFTLTVQELCNSDYNREILIECYDWDKNSEPDFIGEFRTTLNALLGRKDGKETKEGKKFLPGPFTLTRPKHKDPKKRTQSFGTINFSQFELLRNATFLDYIKGGMRIGLMCAIDFTGSNGDPSTSDSLHYRFGKTENSYQQAIRTIGTILAPYDDDGRYSVWGFGGKVGGEVSHCFPLTFNPSQPEVVGVQGILDIYHSALNSVILSGPTYFAEIIETASSIASAPYAPGLQHYTILLIITDGVINDMQKTIASIVRASDLPLSILIVGVGGADFSQMEKLDADDTALASGGKVAKRDIVQFVPYRKFASMHISELAKETLAEIPKQVISFMKAKNYAPMTPREVKTYDPHKMLATVPVVTTTTVPTIITTTAPTTAPVVLTGTVSQPTGYELPPPTGFAPPTGYYSPPPTGYAPPPTGYELPPPTGYAPPPTGYAPPPTAPTGYAPPPTGYVQPPTGYAPPPTGYAPPPTGYVQPPTGYAPPPTGYVQPTTSPQK